MGAGFGFVVNGALEPVPPAAPVAATVYVTPGVGVVVNCTVVDPVAFVVDVADANVPLLIGVDDQVTTRPAEARGAPFWSSACAVTVTGAPATGFASEATTRKEVALTTGAVTRVAAMFVCHVLPVLVYEASAHTRRPSGSRAIPK